MEPASIPPPVVRFGLFEADLHSGELRRGGIRIRMQELPFRALRLFLRHPGEVVSREELRRELWPEDVHVDFDKGISSAINRLRDTLGDTAANPIFLETVERRGYRWIAPVSGPRAGLSNDALPPPRPASVVPIFGEAVESAPSPDLGQSGDQASAPRTAPRTAARIWLALLLAAAVVAAGIYWVIQRGNSKPATSAASARPSADPEAEDLYLKGRYYWNKRTPDDLNKAVEYFNRSLARDPNYASAYVGLADCYNLLREFSAMPPDVAFPRALASAKKAVELDPNNAEAHTSLAFAMFSWNWDRAGAEREFKRALELDPGNARTHHWWATTLLAQVRSAEALQQIEIAQKLDPSSAAILADKALILSAQDHRTEAYELLHQVVDADATLASAHSYLASFYWADKDYEHYFAESATAAGLQHNGTALAENTAAQRGFAISGLPGMYAALLPLQLAAYKQGRGPAYLLAETYINLGRHNDALRMLREAYERREQPIQVLRGDGNFLELKGDPEFEELLRKADQPRG